MEVHIKEPSRRPAVIAVASSNPVKLQATEEGFRQMFPELDLLIHAVEGKSRVGAQPQGDQETLRGAWNRALNAKETDPYADYWVGIEGGVEDQDGEMIAFAWFVVLGDGRVGRSRSGTFFLPPPVANLVRQGKELGEADDIVFGRENSKQAVGAVGLLTGNVVDRAKLYREGVILALIPFKNKSLYPEREGAYDG